MPTTEPLPKQVTPLDVVIAVKISAADGRQGKLEPPENKPDRQSTDGKIKEAQALNHAESLTDRPKPAAQYDGYASADWRCLLVLLCEIDDAS